VHGEPPALDALRGRIAQELGWPVTIPSHEQRVQI
jgi:hypothetical protein